MKKITLTEALSELKLYDKKITKEISELSRSKSTVDYVIGKNKLTEINKMTEEELKEYAQSAVDKLLNLIKNRGILKAAIAKANAITTLNVNGKEYTIVEAIERKNNIYKEKEILNILAENYNNVAYKVSRINENARDEVNRLLEAKLSSDSKNQSSDEIEKLSQVLLEAKEAKILDPYKIGDLIVKMQEEIEEFETNIDVALSIVNAKTEIEVDL